MSKEPIQLGNALEGGRVVGGLFHVGITVEDMERSLLFYRDALGLPVLNDVVLDHEYIKTLVGMTFDSVRVVFLEIPYGGYVELLEYHGCYSARADRQPSDIATGHLCMYVDNIRRVAERLHQRGYMSRYPEPVLITAGPRKGAHGMYFVDPDGFFVELFQASSSDS